MSVSRRCVGVLVQLITMILLEINNRIVEDTLTLKFNNALAGSVECPIVSVADCQLFIRDHVMEHLKVNNLFNDNQYGLIKRRSTNLQLLSVLDKRSR